MRPGERRPASLRREIVVWYSVVLLLSLGAASALTFVLLKQALDRSVRSSLSQAAQTVEDLYVHPAIPRLGTEEQIHRVPRRGTELIRRRTALATGDTITTWVARSDEAEERALRSFLLISLLLIPLTALAAALGGWALLDRLLSPLSRLVDATREIGIARLSRRVSEPERPAELQELARVFNDMLTRLDRAVQALSRFTADASHELRTPLTSIRGTVQVALSRDRSPAELRDTLAEVLEETEWMLHLVDGLLTLARGEEGRVQAERATVDLGALLRDVSEVGEALVSGRPVEMHLEVEGPLLVRGSASQLRQVFLNLVSNAAKFTDRGRVSIQARRVSASPELDGNGMVEVRVTDTGVGIDSAELPRVFDRFYRGEAARGRPGGTGLGLAIARLLVEQHGGRVEVRSTSTTGSEFTVLLPELAPVEAGELPA